MFFLSGVTMVLAGTFVLIYNADLLLKGLTLTGGVLSTLVPSIRTAVAYPLANKFRTGMTIAMISLVMFALVMMSTINENFDRVFLSEDADGGYDIVASENPGSPIGSVTEAMEAEGADTSQIAGEDSMKLANASTSSACEVAEGDLPCTIGEPVDGRNEYESQLVRGISDGFAENTTLKFQSRATGLETDRDVWEAMLENPDYAVVDSFAVGGGDFDDTPLISSIEPTDTSFDPIRIDVRDSATGVVRTVYVIGVIATEGSGLYEGLFISELAFDQTFVQAESSLHLLRVVDGADADGVAKDIESTLLHRGVQADSLQKLIDEFAAQSRGFLYLIQGFMGIGLVVGIAAVGVIAFRTVVERRQQIGMLRAIGYTRGMVGLTFLIESAFIAFMGVLSGVVFALILARQLVTEEFANQGVTSFAVPWLQVLLIAGLAFGFALIMTLIPSRQAANIPIAQALRYE
jgi:putative ABC transport system permease protein